MRSPFRNSTTKPNTLGTRLTEQDIIDPPQAKLLELNRTPDEAMEKCNQPVYMSNWSGTLESEIYQNIC